MIPTQADLQNVLKVKNYYNIYKKIGNYTDLLFEIKEIKKRRTKMTPKEIIKDYKKIYKTKPTRQQLINKNGNIYTYFLRNRLLDKYCLPNQKSKCLQEAIKKYKKIYKKKPKRSKLFKENTSIYYQFRKHNLLNEYCLKVRTLQDAEREYKKIYREKQQREQLKNENLWIYTHFRLNKLLDKYCKPKENGRHKCKK